VTLSRKRPATSRSPTPISNSMPESTLVDRHARRTTLHSPDELIMSVFKNQIHEHLVDPQASCSEVYSQPGYKCAMSTSQAIRTQTQWLAIDAGVSHLNLLARIQQYICSLNNRLNVEALGP
jgi:hypothetical protein